MALIVISALVAAGCGEDVAQTAVETTAGLDAGDGTGNASTTSAPDVAASTSRPPTTLTTPVSEPDIPPLFSDTFEDDRNRWGEIDQSEFGTIDIVGGDQRWIDTTGRVSVWGPGALIEPVEAGELELADVRIRAEATLVRGTGVIGVGCRVAPDDDSEMQWYDFVVRDGYAAIRRSDEQSHIEPLAEQDAADVPFGEPVTIEATCVDDAAGTAHLTLALNGETLLEAADDNPIGNGWAAPVAWTFPVHSPIEVHWHEFSVFEA